MKKYPYFLLLSIVLLGCSASQPSRFYRLVALAEESKSSSKPLSLEVGPFSTSEYLKRPQMVVRTGPVTVDVLEYDRWIEPLEDSLPRTVATNLSNTLKSDQVAVHPFPGIEEASYQLIAEVSEFMYRFDRNEASAVFVWALRSREPRRTLHQGRFEKTVPVESGSLEAQAKGLSELTRAFSREVEAKLPR